MSKRGVALAACIILALTVGFFFWPRSRTAELAKASDRQVAGWVEKMKAVEAIPFLEGGGSYYMGFEPDDESTTTPVVDIDRSITLPLLRRLKQDLDVTVMALIEEDAPDEAHSLVIDLEKCIGKETALQLFFDKEDEAFSGVIPRQLGERWFHFEFVDEQEAAETELGSNWHDDFE